MSLRPATACWGIFRELAHSPGRETDDALILREAARHLEDAGLAVTLKTTEEIGDESNGGAGGGEPPSLLFVMCERREILRRIATWEARGACVVNRSAGIRNTYRDRTASLFARERIPFPRSVLVPTSGGGSPRGPSGSSDLSGVWIKRGDVHATEGGDVVRARDTAEALAALESLARRGVGHALLQEHVAGDLVKFYGIGGVGSESESTGDGDVSGKWFEWFYHRDQDLAGHAFDAGRLADAAARAARALHLEIWGGDAIIGRDGNPVVIDLNAWPSFALYREIAGRRIAEHLLSRFREHASTGVAK